MNSKRLLLITAFCILSVTVLALNAQVFRATDATGVPSGNQSYQADLQKIGELSAARNLKGLVKFADEVQTKWVNDVKPYSYLMVEISNALASYDFKDERQYFYAHKYTKLALEKAEQMPIELEVQLAYHLQGRSEYAAGLVSAKDWPKDRAERTKYVLHAWQRIENEIDRNFDFNDPNNRPVGNVPPPPEARSLPGVSPESIKDPKLRARYEAAIEANNRKAERYNNQLILHKLEKGYLMFAENYLIDVYTTPPFNFEELNQYLTTYGVNNQTKERILVAVSQRMANM